MTSLSTEKRSSRCSSSWFSHGPWTGRLNILHSAARKTLLHTKRGLAGCICRMSHLPAHFFMTDTGSAILLDWRAVKSTRRRNNDLRYTTRKRLIGIFIWRWRLTAITFAHKMKRAYEWFCKAGASRSVLNHVCWLKGWQSLQCFNDCVAFPQHYTNTRRFGNWTYLHRLSRGRVPRERESLIPTHREGAIYKLKSRKRKWTIKSEVIYLLSGVQREFNNWK